MSCDVLQTAAALKYFVGASRILSRFLNFVPRPAGFCTSGRCRLQFLQRLFLVAFAICAGANAATVSLPVFLINVRDTSVSGLSSGGFMAVQFGVAYSSIIKGVGVIAGGPYYCAQGDINIATTKCSCTGVFAFSPCKVTNDSTHVDTLIKQADAYAAAGAIDSTSKLARQHIWLFSGSKDSVVPLAVMRDLLKFYRHYIPEQRIRFINDVPAEHAMPTDGYGKACDARGPPYINNCRFDAAGSLLKWLLGDLRPKTLPPKEGRWIEFDQGEFVEDDQPATRGLAQTGFLYVPRACEGHAAQLCELHVVFHGCGQNVEKVGDKFIRHAGYNHWADANATIVLYPQTAATVRNPNGCWDWFNAERDDPGYATREGRQMRAVKAMVDRIAGVTAVPSAQRLPVCFTSSNTEHVRAGRAYNNWFFLARARGSNRIIGFDTDFFSSTLKKTGPGYYDLGTCP